MVALQAAVNAHSSRRPRAAADSGMTFMEVMVATVIMFTGAVVMISVLPKLIEAGMTRNSRDMAYVYASSKADELVSGSYSSIGTSGSGDFSTLMSGATDAGKYTWSYTSVEEKTDLLKRVTLVVSWGDVTNADKSDTYILYIADKGDD